MGIGQQVELYMHGTVTGGSLIPKVATHSLHATLEATQTVPARSSHLTDRH